MKYTLRGGDTIDALRIIGDKIEHFVAEKTADILLKDIKLNSKSSLSPFIYDNNPPKELEEYRHND